jgi:hypothetical protein
VIGTVKLATGDHVNVRFLDWIWHIKGNLPLVPGQSSEEAFGRLDPLFREVNTSHARTGDTLTFHKKDQAAQDKMSIFDRGVLRIEHEPGGPVLRYHMASRALLFCFLAPLLFLAFAGLNVTLGKLEKPASEAVAKKAEKKDVVLPQNPIDKALGAPAPEKPKKDGADKKNKHSPTPAFVFAALFAALYLVGRVLEDRLVKNLFRKKLQGA